MQQIADKQREGDKGIGYAPDMPIHQGLIDMAEGCEERLRHLIVAYEIITDQIENYLAGEINKKSPPNQP